MLQKQSLETRLLTGFMFVGVIVLIVGIIGWTGNSRLSGHIKSLSTNSIPSISGLWKVNEGQTQIESSERALLDVKLTLPERQAKLTRIKKAWDQINEGFKQYETTPRSVEEEKVYQQLLVAWGKWKQDHEDLLKINQEFESLGILDPVKKQLELLAQGRKDSPEMAAAIVAENAFDKLHEKAKTNRISFEAATQLMLQDLKINEEVANASYKSSNQDVELSTILIVIGLIMGPLTAGGFGSYFSSTIAKPLGAKIAGIVGVAEQVSAGDLTTEVPTTQDRDEVGKLMVAFRTMTQNLNSLIRQVQQSGIQITASATQIAASGKELEATMAEQVASTNEVAATAKEIAANSKQLLKTIDDVEHTSEVTGQAAGESQKDLLQMEKTMKNLAGSTNSISTKLGVISDKANSINTIVTTITKVADQTNLLSLNAAIEAEKAGEYGAGFAVVAREIRRLADQTAVATLDIETMVKEMQGAVSTGVMEMDKFTKEVERGVDDVRNIGGKLESIIRQVQTLTPQFDQVGKSMEGQSQGAQQISEAMVQLSESSAQTSQSLREINHAIGQLNEAAQGLRKEISHFKVGSN
ncbi:chemotaxis protein [Oscillatoriales cyanobacterium USR001]|nr:chemotaxis protein [Oscillatoriales cyanobacterium USR001]